MKTRKLLLLLCIVLVIFSIPTCKSITETDKVATPTFSPSGGSFTTDQNVSISCTTSDATIRYTVNGSSPTETSPEYTAPIPVTTTTTLKARAYLEGSKESSIATAVYTITQAPVDMNLVTAGTFTMGDTDNDGYIDERPTHSVTLSSFYMGKYEVTQKEWIETMGNNPAHDNGVGDNFPVYNVTWFSALKYCNLRSMAEGLTPAYTISGSTDPGTWGATIPGPPTLNPLVCNWNANGYRLPTEAEWEYAARGGTNNPDYTYSGSNNINEVAYYYDGSATAISVVGTKAPNSLGLYDMSGNVYEYCWDVYVQNYYTLSPGTNPTGPANTYFSNYRVKRGGAFCFPSNECQVTHRESTSDVGASGHYSMGFRVCRTAL